MKHETHKWHRTICLALLSLCFASQGSAEEVSENKKRFLEGWYVGAGAGWTWNDVEQSDFPEENNIDDTGGGFRALIGYHFTPIFSVEARYLYLGEVEFEDGDIVSNGATLNALVTSPPIVIAGNISLGAVQVKVGATYVYRDQSDNIKGRDVNGGEFGWVYGFGWQREVTFLSKYVPGTFFSRLEWERLFDDAYDTDFLSFGMLYMF